MAKKSDMTKADLEKFKQILLALKARLTGDVNMMASEAFSGGTGSHAPTHMADLGTDAYEQEFTLNLMANEGDRLDQVKAALERIANGQYGCCLECEGRIAKARLEVIPDTPYCVKCASKVGNSTDDE